MKYWSSRRVLLPAEDGYRVTEARIGVAAGRIVEVSEGARCDDLHPGDDLGDLLLAPAFVNAHTHLSLGVLRGIDLRRIGRGNMVEDFFFQVEENLSPGDVRAFVRLGAYDSLLAGVGMVWDHYYAADEVAAGLADAGLSGIVAPTLQDLAGPGRHAWEAQLDATARIDDDAQLGAKGIGAALGPHATDTVSAALFTRAAELAERRDLPLHAHLAQSPEELKRAYERHGCSPAAWLEQLGMLAARGVWAHAIYCDDADLTRLAAADQTLVWCPYSALVFGFPAQVTRWHGHGLRWAIATDCASNNDTMNVQQELRLVAAQRTAAASWSGAYAAFLAGEGSAEAAWQERADGYDAAATVAAPSSMLQAVWTTPGSLHPRLRAGVIARGALANIMAIDLGHPSLWPAHDPLHVLAMADVAPAIRHLWVVGEPIGGSDLRSGLLGSPELRDARREAEERLTKLLARAGVDA